MLIIPNAKKIGSKGELDVEVSPASSSVLVGSSAKMLPIYRHGLNSDLRQISVEPNQLF